MMLDNSNLTIKCHASTSIRGMHSRPGICCTSRSCTRTPFLSRVPPTAQSGSSISYAIPAAHSVSSAQPVPSSAIPCSAGTAASAIHISLLPLPLLPREDVPLLVCALRFYLCARILPYFCVNAIIRHIFANKHTFSPQRIDTFLIWLCKIYMAASKRSQQFFVAPWRYLANFSNVPRRRQYYYPTPGGGARLLPAVDLRRHGIPAAVHGGVRGGGGGDREDRFYDSRFYERY